VPIENDAPAVPHGRGPPSPHLAGSRADAEAAGVAEVSKAFDHWVKPWGPPPGLDGVVITCTVRGCAGLASHLVGWTYERRDLLMGGGATYHQHRTPRCESHARSFANTYGLAAK